MRRKDIQQRLGLKDEKHFRTSYQQPAVAAGLIEMTIPINQTAVCRNTESLQKALPVLRRKNNPALGNSRKKP